MLEYPVTPPASRVLPLAGVGMSPTYSNILFINIISALFDQIEEFVAGALVSKEDTAEGRCGGDCIGLLHTSEGHACV